MQIWASSCGFRPFDPGIIILNRTALSSCVLLPDVLYWTYKEGNRKRLPDCIVSCYLQQPSTICGSWRLFPFSLEYLITETNKGNYEYTKLNQIRICNHLIALLSSVWRVFLSLRKRRVAAWLWFPCLYIIILATGRQPYFQYYHLFKKCIAEISSWLFFFYSYKIIKSSSKKV